MVHDLTTSRDFDQNRPMPNYSQHQKKIIRRYYDNLDQIALTRLGEIATELYLAETVPQKKRLWDRADKAMQKLKIPPNLSHHILQSQDPEILAQNLKNWLKASG